MKLNRENYHSPEMTAKYMSVSQYKGYAGSMGRKACEAKTIALLKGDWEWPVSKDLLVGSYVDEHFSGGLDLFKGKNPDIICKTGKNIGQLKSEFRRADEIIARIERDPLFMKTLEGEKQTIMTAELFGIEWKIMMDSYLVGRAIADLKIMKSLRDLEWVKDHGKLDFITYWGYDIQGAIYQEIVRLNTGIKLPFFVAGASKEPVTDIDVFWVDNQTLDTRLYEVERNIKRVIDVKTGKLDPERCGTCDYCKWTKVLKKPIHFTELYGQKI